VPKFDGRTILKSQVMGCQIHVMGKVIRRLSLIVRVITINMPTCVWITDRGYEVIYAIKVI